MIFKFFERNNLVKYLELKILNRIVRVKKPVSINAIILIQLVFFYNQQLFKEKSKIMKSLNSCSFSFLRTKNNFTLC